jgi:hypothetical protein
MNELRLLLQSAVGFDIDMFNKRRDLPDLTRIQHNEVNDDQVATVGDQMYTWHHSSSSSVYDLYQKSKAPPNPNCSEHLLVIKAYFDVHECLKRHHPDPDSVMKENSPETLHVALATLLPQDEIFKLSHPVLGLIVDYDSHTHLKFVDPTTAIEQKTFLPTRSQQNFLLHNITMVQCWVKQNVASVFLRFLIYNANRLQECREAYDKTVVAPLDLSKIYRVLPVLPVAQYVSIDEEATNFAESIDNMTKDDESKEDILAVYEEYIDTLDRRIATKEKRTAKCAAELIRRGIRAQVKLLPEDQMTTLVYLLKRIQDNIHKFRQVYNELRAGASVLALVNQALQQLTDVEAEDEARTNYLKELADLRGLYELKFKIHSSASYAYRGMCTVNEQTASFFERLVDAASYSQYVDEYQGVSRAKLLSVWQLESSMRSMVASYKSSRMPLDVGLTTPACLLAWKVTLPQVQSARALLHSLGPMKASLCTEVENFNGNEEQFKADHENNISDTLTQYALRSRVSNLCAAHIANLFNYM